MSQQQERLRHLGGIDVAELLMACWPKNAAKRAAQAAEVSPRTAENWLCGRREPSTRTLWKMAANSAALRAQLIRSLAELDRATESVNDAEMARAGAAVDGRQAA